MRRGVRITYVRYPQTLTHAELRSVRRARVARPVFLALAVGLGAATPVPAADLAAGPCFDFRQKVVAPLTPPIPLIPGRDNHVFGTSPGGVGWASGRVVLDMPVASAYANLLDHRNVKDMTRTTLSTTVLDRPDYMAFHLVKIVVTLRALFLKMEVPWTEAWAFSLVEGTPDAPRRIVVSYQKVAGTDHIKRECGSYVLQAREDGTTDLSLYEEVKADRRSARDTRDMHRGIVKNLRVSHRLAGPPAPAVAIQ
jgi:hypothetical protein